MLCATAATIAALLLTAVMHYRGGSIFAAQFFIAAVVSGMLLGVAGIVLGGALGRGTPRVAALLWSLVVLASIAYTVLQALSALNSLR
jgi:hypothetical protein